MHRSASEADLQSRCNEIKITPRGEAALARSPQPFQELDARCYTGFSDEETTQLDALLNKYLNNLNQVKKEEEMEK